MRFEVFATSSNDFHNFQQREATKFNRHTCRDRGEFAKEVNGSKELASLLLAEPGVGKCSRSEESLKISSSGKSKVAKISTPKISNLRTFEKSENPESEIAFGNLTSFRKI